MHILVTYCQTYTVFNPAQSCTSSILNNRSSAVGHQCTIWQTYFQEHIPIMWSECILVFLVTLLIAVSSYGAYKQRYLTCICKIFNFHIWHTYDIWGAYLLMANIWQQHGKWKLCFFFELYRHYCEVHKYTTIMVQWNVYM